MFLIKPTPRASVYVSVKGQMLGCSSLLNGGGLKSAETRFSRRLHVPQLGWVSKTFGKSRSPSRLQLCRFLKANWIFPLVSTKVFYKRKTCLTTSLYARLYMILVPFFSMSAVTADCWVRALGLDNHDAVVIFHPNLLKQAKTEGLLKQRELRKTDTGREVCAGVAAQIDVYHLHGPSRPAYHLPFCLICGVPHHVWKRSTGWGTP